MAAQAGPARSYARRSGIDGGTQPIARDCRRSARDHELTTPRITLGFPPRGGALSADEELVDESDSTAGGAPRRAGERGGSQPHPASLLKPGDGRRGAGDAAPPRGLRPGSRGVGSGQRDRVPGQRVLDLPDRRGRLRVEPAPLRLAELGPSISGSGRPTTSVPGLRRHPAGTDAAHVRLAGSTGPRRRSVAGGGGRGQKPGAGRAVTWRTSRGSAHSLQTTTACMSLPQVRWWRSTGVPPAPASQRLPHASIAANTV